MNNASRESQTVVLDRTSLAIDAREVLRLQGYRREAAPGPGVRGLMAAAIEEGRRLIRPRAVFAEVDVREAAEGRVRLGNGLSLAPGIISRHWAGAEYLVVALCTIGISLEKRIADLFAEAEYAPALMLDSVGSVAVENVADAMNLEFCRKAASLGLNAGPRASPGYGSWDLREQRTLFSIVAGDEIGVSLNLQCLMTPRKSISLCVAVGRSVRGKASDRCRRCGMADCQYRREPRR